MGSPIYLFLSLLCFSCSVTLTTAGVKTCTTELEYYFNLFGQTNGGTCQIDPDGGASPMEILGRWGCTVEEKILTTGDGYQVSVIRAYSKNLNTSLAPILMVHGIYMNTRGFMSSQEKSLAYQFLVAGGGDRQVFFLSLRGTIYSTGNINGLDQSNYAYWNFSWHEMGKYDVAAALEFVWTTTGQKAIVIGYSMGTTVTTVYLSLDPATAQSRVRNFIAMAPVVILNKQIRSILGGLATIWPLVQPMAKLAFNGQILKKNPAYTSFCALVPVTMQMCYSVTVPIFGNNYPCLDYEKRPIQITNNPDSICEKVITHYAQLINSGRFQKFDYGSAGNLVAYNSATPPEYPLSDINVPVTYIVSDNDWLAEKSNALLAYNKIRSDCQCGFMRVSDTQFAHDNFINHKDQLLLLNQRLEAIINNQLDQINPTCPTQQTI
uniref:Gastric triacylglycerol lipase-like n=1 Tax=Diabrotica virgifera virgifera TaxID=50390 RepID=A0A6P7FEU7_DIAVI